MRVSGVSSFLWLDDRTSEQQVRALENEMVSDPQTVQFEDSQQVAALF